MEYLGEDIIEYVVQEEYMDPTDTASTGKQCWVEAPVKLMLTLLEEMLPNVGKSATLKNKKKLWTVIAEELRNNGSFKAVVVCGSVVHKSVFVCFLKVKVLFK
ncbi:uncharacterized protein [Musca autumnalis]|uniref:uncharacterized protein n=1 Tax=Musca autumnalis TaxID=221902 RepID=UPI003CE68472